MNAEEIKLLAGEEFNNILAGDAVLNALEKMKYSSKESWQLLLEVLQLGDYRIGNLPVRPLTVAKWSLLWLLESPFVVGGTAELKDWDIFLYVLAQLDLRQLDLPLDRIALEAEGFTLATALEADALEAEVKNVIKSAFLPFEMMPLKASGKSSEDGVYDGMWASFMAAAAARESGMSFDYCMHQMTLGCVCALVVNWHRRESMDADKIHRRFPEDIERKIAERIDVLAQEYIARMNQE